MSPQVLRASAILLVAGFALSACSSNNDDAAIPTSASGKDLVLCSDIPYEPMEFEATTEKTPSGYTGFDIDLAQQIADGADRNLSVRVTPFDGIFAAMDGGNCDAVVSSVTITEERKKTMDFSDPYFDSDQSLLVLKENAGTYTTLTDLAGKNIGVQSASTGEEFVNNNTPSGATVTALPSATDLFAALESGTIDAIVQDYPINAYRATQNDNVSISERIPTGEKYGIAVKNGDADTLDLFNKGLTSAKADGSYDRLHEKYFGQAPTES
jgi:polar amino acid transport system substrate-binding protein